MGFQIHALSEKDFEHLFELSDDALSKQSIDRQIVTECPGTPCRVSLDDAEVGETVLLLNYKHQPNDTPYQATHAIFVRQGLKQAFPDANEVPKVFTSRLISVRAFDQTHRMINADVATGSAIKEMIEAYFSDPSVEYIHLHNAKPGCFAASVVRV